jgi:hypothetical protein
MLREHFKAIRAHPTFRNANILFFPERNTGHEGGHMELILREVDSNRSFTYKERQDRDYGINTSRERKLMCADRARVAMAQDCVHYLSDMITVNTEHENHDVNERREAMKQEFEKQMARYKYIKKNRKTDFEQARYTVSGKTDKYGNITTAANDDLMVCFCYLIAINELLAIRQLPGMTEADYNWCADADSTETNSNMTEAFYTNNLSGVTHKKKSKQ